MPKILVTGFGDVQCNRLWHMRPRCQIKLVPSTHSLVNCLLDMGYEVDQRAVTLGEDLSMYDEVIAFIWAPREFVSVHVFETLYAISQHPGCILSMDDWQLVEKFKALAKAGERENIFAKRVLDINKKTLEDVNPYAADIRAGLQVILQKQNRMLLCAFSASHLIDQEEYGVQIFAEKLGYPKARIFTYNPNPYHRNRTWESLEHHGDEDPEWKKDESPDATTLSSTPRPKKRRRFNFASMVQSRTATWLKKQGFVGDLKKSGFIGSWPVDMYGHRASKQIRLTEDEMVRVITRDWACLLPAYGHAGSGWWRARPLQCADADSVLVGDERELRVYYGDDYPYYGLTAKDVAALSEDELRDVAAAQKECIYRHHPLTKTVQQEEMRTVMEAEK